MKKFRVESDPRCPSCRRTLGGASSPFEKSDDPGPGPGDFTVCACCGAIMRYTDDMQLKICDKSDMEEAMKHNLGEKLLQVSMALAPIIKKTRQEDAAKN